MYDAACAQWGWGGVGEVIDFWNGCAHVLTWGLKFEVGEIIWGVKFRGALCA